MKKTKIDYLTHTWNPLAMRCDPVSEGCSHCWHLGLCERMAVNPVIPQKKRLVYAGIEKNFILDPIELEAPKKRKKPAIVGVQFMGDLFHPRVPMEYVRFILETIKKAPQHQFLILTKRPEGLVTYQRIWKGLDLIPNLWLGVSVEDQKTADERIPVLLHIPVKNRFLSIEPMLGPISWKSKDKKHWLGDIAGVPLMDWVICGGESGSYARPLNPEWVRDLRDQCRSAGVPFYFKQWGEWLIQQDLPNIYPNDNPGKKNKGRFFGDDLYYRVGKKQAGHLIDGVEIRELPEALKGVLND